MANQMIALGVRGPQLPNLAGAAAQYGNMMANMATMKEKQAGIQRANAFRQLVSDPGFDPANPEHIKAAQSLDPVGAEKIVSAADARRKANLEYIGQLTQQFRDQLAVIDPSDKAAYGALREEIVKAVPGWGSRLPTAEQWGPDARVRTLMKADDVISKTIATPTASVQVSPTGTLQAVTVGGLGEPSAKEIPEYRYVPDRPAPPATEAAPAAAPVSGAPARATRGGATTPQDLLDQGVDSRSIPTGSPLQPMSFGGEGMGAGAIQPLTMETAPQIIQTAIQNGVIDQSHVEQLRQMVGPENDQALANWMRQNNVRIQPTGAPSMRSAVYRQPAVDYFAPQVADDGMPFGGPTNALRQNIGYEATGRAAQAKPPMQSPMPGSAIVPLPRVAGEAAATEGGKQNVRVVTEPKIAGGTKTAELQAQKDMAFPDAQGQFEAALATIDNRLADIKRFREHPAATRVIGPLDAFTPNFGRARGAQAIYDALVATATLDELMQMRQNSPTGGALGNVSDADIRVLRQSIGALGQDQSEEDFNDSLRIFEDRLRQTRERLIRRYKENYGYRLGKDWQPPATSTRRKPAAGGRRVGGFTVMEVED